MMDIEFDLQYKNLLVHHLEREEVEYELKIRGIEFTEQETRSTIARRLKERLKVEKCNNNANIDFDRLETTVEEEIAIVDRNLKQIKDFLLHKKKYEGARVGLKTRLVHYFARVKRLTDNMDSEEDLNDIDTIETCIRGTYNNFFSIFSPEGQHKIVNQINQSMSNTQISSADPNSGNNASGSSHDTDLPFVTPGRQVRRQLQSVENSAFVQNQGPNQNMLQSFMQACAYPWMFGPPPMQMWAAQRMLHFNSAENLNSKLTSLGDQGGRKQSSLEENVIDDAPHRDRNATRPRNLDETDSKSGWSSDRSRRETKYKNRLHRSSKGRPVSDWRLRYDGADNGQSLMKFIKEVEFYAKSEKMSNKELFRSAIHLFGGPAKTWFMTGVENDDFTSWDQLKKELKREFLSPDHDHFCETRAINRKQGPRERFQDYYMDMQTLFNSLTKPITERKKFDIVYRNMRADYKGHVISKDIDNLADLKHFGRRLDATYWYKFQTPANDSNYRGKAAQVNEVHTGTKPKSYRKTENEPQKTRHYYNSNLQSRSSDEEVKRNGNNSIPKTNQTG
ncbi:uncharacterized protein LOC129725612 isoform X2 [Wyeomyia smithii]|uniref:uncharacterized protein LOC129725612 isoform X2 n=1 Tax=Wyeomyia smithii TaxID=174621 RepID=UPI00246804DB|nr:uncharacterized protein LOC129725612 isoform X2 [Wyeomyia smithii]